MTNVYRMLEHSNWGAEGEVYCQTITQLSLFFLYYRCLEDPYPIPEHNKFLGNRKDGVVKQHSPSICNSFVGVNEKGLFRVHTMKLDVTMKS